MADISNTQDIMDSRDIIERFEELTGERQALEDDLESAKSELEDAEAELVEAESEGRDPEKFEADVERLKREVEAAKESLESWDKSNDADDLKALDDLCKQGESYADDWAHGATLVRDTYFEEYAQEFAEDIGAIDRNAGWPACHIDWAAAAYALKQDYCQIEFSGETYWVR